MLDGPEARMQGQQESLRHFESQLETAKEVAQRPFPQEDELKEKQARLDQLNSLLCRMKSRTSSSASALPCWLLSRS